MNQVEKAARFAELHVKGAPLPAVQCVGRRHREIDPGRGRKGDCDQQLGGSRKRRVTGTAKPFRSGSSSRSLRAS